MAIKQLYYGSKEYNQMVNLRLEIMRKPLGLTFSADELQKEKDDILIGAFDEDEIDNTTVKLRQMAVQKNQQGMGIGESMMAFAENIARDKGYRILTMHARDTAIGFYEKFGYKVKGPAFIEVNINHHEMEKKLV
jgi:ribosomal protein S18 acetylase RimI-like enzyme